MYARLEQLIKPEQDEFLSLIETQSTRIDYYETLITALYTGPLRKRTRIGPDFPVQTIIDLPETGAQLHIHGPDKNTYTYGTIKSYGSNEVLKELSGVDCAFAERIADNINLKKIKLFLHHGEEFE